MDSLNDLVYNDLLMTDSETETADAIADIGNEVGEFLSCHSGGNTSLGEGIVHSSCNVENDSSSKCKFSIASLNCQGICDYYKRNALFEKALMIFLRRYRS